MTKNSFVVEVTFNKYDIIVMGDLNIDISDKRKYNNNFLSDLWDTFSLKNIIIGKTCHKSNVAQSAFTCSKLTIETLEQGVRR